MDKIKVLLYIFIVSIGLMIVSFIQEAINYSTLLPKGISENLNFIIYQTGYHLSIITAIAVIITGLLFLKNNKNI